MKVIDFSFAQKRSIVKKISLDLPILPHMSGREMDMSREFDKILKRLERLQRIRRALSPQLDVKIF
jgi:hypothetical protein